MVAYGKCKCGLRPIGGYPIGYITMVNATISFLPVQQLQALLGPTVSVVKRDVHVCHYIEGYGHKQWFPWKL